MTLLQLQRDMRAWLRSGSAVAAGRFGAAAAAGLSIYQNNFRAQLAGCLEDSFPSTLAWIGAEAFHDAIVAHVERVPPSSWTLDAYSRDFPATLHIAFPYDPEVEELAELELALSEAFVGPDAAPIVTERLATIDWDHAELGFVPTLRLLAMTTNAPSIHAALMQGETPPAVDHVANVALVWRSGFESRVRVIDAAERDAVELIRHRRSFATLCEAMVIRDGEDAGVAAAGAYLGRWLADGLIATVEETHPV